MVRVGKLGVGSGKHPQALRKVDAKGCAPAGVQRAPRAPWAAGSAPLPRYPAVIPVIPIPGPLPDSPRRHRDPTPAAASGFRHKAEVGGATAGRGGRSGPSPLRA